MYSIKRIVSLWGFNQYFISLLYSIIFSSWIVSAPSQAPIFSIMLFVFNYVFVTILLTLIRTLVRKVYRPNFYLRTSMKLTDAIYRNVVSGGKTRPIYDDKDLYDKRLHFEIELRTLFITLLINALTGAFILYIIALTGIVVDGFSVNYKRILLSVIAFFGYFTCIEAIESYEFDKVRFGKANLFQILISHSIFFVIISSVVWGLVLIIEAMN